MNQQTHSIATLAKSASLFRPEFTAASRVMGKPSTATIKIQNLRLRTYIGFNPEEQAKQQDVVINASIQHKVSAQTFDDSVEHALNYKVITKKIIQCVEQGRFLLLEKLVADLLQICAGHPEVTWASMTVDKPHALRFADSVSLTMEYVNKQYKPETWTC